MNIGTLLLKNNLFLAPMAGISDLAFRTVARSFGASLCYSEMVSANGLTRNTHRSFEYLASSPEDKPLAVQLFGSDPAVLAEAARIAGERGADLVDINMGCPVKKVIRTGAGAALMRDSDRIAEILSVMRRATELPLTVKVRAGWSNNNINVVKIARMAEDAGVDAITVHPRTALQGYRGQSDWLLIKKVKDVLSIPVIGSGDLWTADDVERMRAVTGCDAVMIARGSLGNPWIFKQSLCSGSAERACPPSPSEREKTIRRHLELSLMTHGPKTGMLNFRKHLLWYTKGLPGGARFRKSVVEKKEKEEILDALHDFLHGEWDRPT